MDMILKPIKDEKIDKIVNESKDYNIKVNPDAILHAYELRKQNKVTQEIEEPVKKRKFNPFLVGGTCVSFASIALVIGLSLGLTRPQEIKRNVNNISNSAAIFSDANSEISHALGKEILLFNFNSQEEVPEANARTMLKKAINFNLNEKEETNILDNILNNVANGFEKIAQVFLNQIIEFNDIDIRPRDVTSLFRPEVDGITFDKAVHYHYFATIGYDYFYSTDENATFGLTKFSFYNDYYKTYVTEVKEDGKTFIETTLISTNNPNNIFKINNKNCLDNLDNNYNYFYYKDKTTWENNSFYESYEVNFDENNLNSTYKINKVEEAYSINYKNIALDIINMITGLLFNVDYIDHNTITPYTFEVNYKVESNESIYDFGDIGEIII